jgi:hypothetical protein
MLLTVAVSVADTNVSVLSEISATRGSFFECTRREKSGGMVSTPFTRPLRRSVMASPRSRSAQVHGVRAGRDAPGQLAHLHACTP